MALRIDRQFDKALAFVRQSGTDVASDPATLDVVARNNLVQTVGRPSRSGGAIKHATRNGSCKCDISESFHNRQFLYLTVFVVRSVLLFTNGKCRKSYIKSDHPHTPVSRFR